LTDYDLCIAWNWEYDADFVALLQAACEARGRSLLQVTPANVDWACRCLDSSALAFRLLVDRASDELPGFLPLAEWARHSGARSANPHERAQRAWDKAAMHAEFLAAGIRTPYTVILPALHTQPDVPAVDLRPLEPSFVIKPAGGSGGHGVVREARVWSDVLSARGLFPDDRYLLQARIVPVCLGTRPAYFRVIYCLGYSYPCWWDPETHAYAEVSPAEEVGLGLTGLRELARRVAAVCGLEVFSSEIALAEDGALTAVDYVNDPIDLRLQSQTPEGVPDEIVRGIAERLAEWE
jgi:hypothetical protein